MSVQRIGDQPSPATQAAEGTNPAAPASAPIINGGSTIRVKERNRQDPGLLELDQHSLNPNRHYRWVRCRSDEHVQSVTKHKLKGYEIEKHSESGPRTIAQADYRPDNVIAIGDLVLMSCPKEHHLERAAARHARTENFLRNTAAETKQMAAEKGVKIVDEENHDQQMSG